MTYRIHSIPGPTPFQVVHEMQRAFLQDRIENRIPDTLIICEHMPVITRGRGLQWREDRTERSKDLPLVPPGTDYVEIERGGDLTWHGPGQLVIYPIVKLGGEGEIGRFIGQDVDRYVRFLENIWIEALRPYGVETTSKQGGSGVWLKGKKLASVGIALKRWTSYHGVAMNIVNDLEPFMAFSPCGFQSEVMARLRDLPGLPEQALGSDWRSFWESRIQESLVRLLLSKT
jgi:lipoate-protein ligase B